ncbi:MAG: diguanylate cyclase [Saccharospirillum sp.]|uniref:sensor domain-containing diguanylate cyclase n=1 Tax=Saccharospirillum sp. TaxID=2033801 RepID=UPI003297CBCD
MLGFGATFVAIAWLTLERGWSHWNLPVAALYFLVYPHLVYWNDRWRQASVSSERRAMMFDGLVLGAWCAHINFSGWISFTLLAAVILNNTMTGGIRQCARALGFFVLGIALIAFSSEVAWSPEAPLGINVLTMVSLQLYIFSIAWVFYIQKSRLVGTKKNAEQKNVIFSAMLELSDLNDQVDSFESLVSAALDVLQRLYPDQSFGFVLKDPREHDDLYFAVFTPDLDDEQQTILKRRLARTREHLPQGYFLNTTDQHTGSFVFPMRERFDRFQGLLLIQGATLSEQERQALQLLIKQLGTAVANKLLTLELKAAAERDALTGIYNRGHLESELTEAQNRLKTDANDHFSVILIDLIGLKSVNDQYGHAAGDELIRFVADALKSICRDQDQVFRYGGDEFVILCRSEDESGAAALMQRIDRQVKQKNISLTTDDGAQVKTPIQMSVGLASSDQVPPEDVLKLADERMYADKERWYRERSRYR